MAEFLLPGKRRGRKKNEKNSANGRQLATFLFKFETMNYVQIDIGI
jgi:hypothetical protein